MKALRHSFNLPCECEHRATIKGQNSNNKQVSKKKQKRKIFGKRSVSSSSFSSKNRTEINDESSNDEFIDLSNECVGCDLDYDNIEES